MDDEQCQLYTETLILTLSSRTIWSVELFWLCLRNVKEFDQTDRHMDPFVTTRICEEGILQVTISMVSSFKCETISNQKKILWADRERKKEIGERKSEGVLGPGQPVRVNSCANLKVVFIKILFWNIVEFYFRIIDLCNHLKTSNSPRSQLTLRNKEYFNIDS